MSRTTLTPGAALACAAALALFSSALALDPHLDPTLVPEGCAACHRGHGAPGSPMLPAVQTETCLSCHDTQARRDLAAMRGAVRGGSRARLLSRALTQAFTHPLTAGAYSASEVGAVTCTSCHSPHRGMARSSSDSSRRVVGKRRASLRNPGRFEFQMCGRCHGGEAAGTGDVLNMSRLHNPNNRSFHPVEAPALHRSPSVLPELSGRAVNCTDCHGNSDPSGPRGPHGSGVRHILKTPYTTVDGREESLSAYGLCYSCHDRAKVLDSPLFPSHRLHVVEQRTSCVTCHNPHGSVRNRALIRFGDEPAPAGVSPSTTTGQLGFASAVAGSGSCALTCHAHDHGPSAYGGLAGGVETRNLLDQDTKKQRDRFRRGRSRTRSREPSRHTQ